MRQNDALRKRSVKNIYLTEKVEKSSRKLYRVYRETSPIHRMVNGIEMNLKVPYRLAIFAIIIEILIFEIVLMRARRDKRFSHSKYSPAQFIKRIFFLKIFFSI